MMHVTNIEDFESHMLREIEHQGWSLVTLSWARSAQMGEICIQKHLYGQFAEVTLFVMRHANNFRSIAIDKEHSAPEPHVFGPYVGEAVLVVTTAMDAYNRMEVQFNG